MNGLNKILEKIAEDNLNEVNKIIDDAKATADKIISQAQNSANEEADEIISACDKKNSQMLENAKSGCEVFIKRAEASAKAEVVAKCIGNAALQLKSMEDEKYFEAIKRLVLKYYHPNEQGELLMNERDLKRIPKKFADMLNKELKEDNAAIIISQKSIDIDSGFIISYDGVEENCSFDSLVDEKLDEIKDKLYKLMA